MAVGLETAIPVVGQLLGELFGKKKGPSTYQQTQEAMGALAKYAREYGEQYGFSPLTLLGASSPVARGQIMDNPMEQAIADASMILGDAWTKRTDAQKLQRSHVRINELQAKLDHQTLRPKIGGVYAQREASPTCCDRPVWASTLCGKDEEWSCVSPSPPGCLSPPCRCAGSSHKASRITRGGRHKFSDVGRRGVFAVAPVFAHRSHWPEGGQKRRRAVALFCAPDRQAVGLYGAGACFGNEF